MPNLNNTKTKVLYVDDEIHNLTAFKALFRKEYEVLTAKSGDEGLEVLKQEEQDGPVHVIISDQRMPGMEGTEFLEKVQALYPASIRVLLTGYTDMKSLIDAVNKGKIYRYLTKPWEENTLRNTIINATESYNDKVFLKEKVKELERANEELSRFIYSASHDLRAPLTTVIGLVKLLRSDERSDFDKKIIENIDLSVKKLDDFVKKIIDYYKNERQENVIEKIDMNAIVDSILNSLGLHNSQNITFHKNIDDTINFYSDSFRLYIIVSNLISNAVKYHNPNNPNPSIWYTFSADEQNCTIEIKDNGMGIEKEYLDRIFEMFFRTETSSLLAGSGIGLYIVKETVSKLNGSISVESEINHGTTFKVKLPLKNNTYETNQNNADR